MSQRKTIQCPKCYRFLPDEFCTCHKSPTDIPMNYERDYSHSHCWESENPPCGIKGKHRCCLCESPLPVEIMDDLTKGENGWKVRVESTVNSWEANLNYHLHVYTRAVIMDENRLCINQYEGYLEECKEKLMKCIQEIEQAAEKRGRESTLREIIEEVKDVEAEYPSVYATTEGQDAVYGTTARILHLLYCRLTPQGDNKHL